MAIRPYEARDKENVQFICLNSDGPDNFSDIGREFLLTTYCDYYTEQEPENCFVATDENDNAIGYILCAENFDKFREVFIGEYTSRLAHSEFHCTESKKTLIMIEKFKDEYPAHLHIDLLPDYHRKGLGTLLMDALCEHLKAKGVKGIVLTLWYKNTNACRFYEKYGFEILHNEAPELAYGLKL